MKYFRGKYIILCACILLLAGCKGKEEQKVTVNSEEIEVATTETEITEDVDDSIPDISKIADLAVGDSVTFGKYEQDNDESNGEEPIEWIILDKQDGKTLLLSKYGLDGIWFDVGESTTASWEESNIRSWLNVNFYNGAFDENDKNQIVKVNNSTPDSTAFWESIGREEFECPETPDTQDNVFLLSLEELDKYLERSTEENETSKCLPTAYCDSKDINSPTKAAWWWLRSFGGNPAYAAVVNDGGMILSEFKYHEYSSVPTVRPALWVGEGDHEPIVGLKEYVDSKAVDENAGSKAVEGGAPLPYSGFGGLYSGNVNGQYYYVWIEKGNFSSASSSGGTIKLLWKGSAPFEDGTELLDEESRGIYLGDVQDGYLIKPGFNGEDASILTIDEDEFGNLSGRIYCFGTWMQRDDSLIYDGKTLRHK